jgi:hypothetical protein
MKLSFVLGTLVVGVALTGWAQEVKAAKPLKPRTSEEFKVKEGAKTGKPTAPAPGVTTARTPAKDLRHIEAEHPRQVSNATKRLPAAALQEKKSSSPKINVAAKPTEKTGLNRKGPNPYQGRLKQKNTRH